VKAFGELSITKTAVRELTQKEKEIAKKGDIGQGERLMGKK
jgi:hypothetical protein